MKYLSVCSGVEAATVAWHDLGWEPVAFSDIEKFPSEVLAHHYPNVPNLGDMTKYKEWNLNDSIDLLVGGTPCQSFSVAGLRKGLEDPRGNLMLTYVGILDKFRPQWCVWENVPGVLSSNEGRDFGSFLGALVELGYGFAYRVLDAQYFGVPQRRRRVFVVGCIGDWVSPAKILFESDCLRGNPPKSRSKKKETPGIIAPSVANCLQTTCNDYSRADGFNMITHVYENHPSDSRVKPMGDVCQTVTSSWGTGGGNIPFVQSIALAENTIGRKPENGGNGNGFTESGPMYTLNATGVHGVAYSFEPGIAKREGSPARFVENKTPTLRANMGDNQTAMAHNMAVRRLTPIECERLQGFPDDYTNIKDKCPDGPRYKAMGNSMAVPVMRWIGKRIAEVA
jgi:DNA (cytosine-5)-methyltransferase 1